MTGDITFRPYVAPGWVKAIGETVNRVDYPTLTKFADDNGLWTDTPEEEPWKFGNGDGSQTMVLPDYRGRVIQGGDTVGVKSAGLPNLAGYLGNFRDNYKQYDGKLFNENNMTGSTYSGSSSYTAKTVLAFDASKYNAIYGASDTVQPPAVVLIPQIKI